LGGRLCRRPDILVGFCLSQFRIPHKKLVGQGKGRISSDVGFSRQKDKLGATEGKDKF